MIDNVLVSVIVPVYNSNQYIDKCLYNLLHQTYKNIEIICIDDGSTDNSLNTLLWYQEHYENIRVYSQENSGAAITRNRGIDLAKGEYLLFVDIDDWIDLNSIELLYKNAIANSSDLVLFNSTEFNEKGKIRDRIFFYIDSTIDPLNYSFNHKTKKDLVFNSFLVCWSKFYKKSFLELNNLKFHEHKVLEDIQFHVEAMILANTISYSPGKMYHYRKDNSISVQNLRVNTKVGFVLFDIFNELEHFLLKHELYDFYELNYIKFVLNESKVRLNTANENIKEELYHLIRNYFLKINIPIEFFNNIDSALLKFYIHIISTETFFEYMTIDKTQKIMVSDKSLLSEILEKNTQLVNLQKEIDDLKYYKEVLDNISIMFDKNDFLDRDTISKIYSMGMFDEDYYKDEYDYKWNLNPLLHYLFKGFEEGKNPSKEFDGNFYKEYNTNITDSQNPLVYFIQNGLKEGLVKITENSWQPPYVNLFEIDKKFSNFKNIGINFKRRKTKVILSLTSFPERMNDIHYCLYSLLNQSFKPDKIILWLAKEQFPNKELDIPKKVLKLINNGLEIRYCEDLKSYKKLIPSLKEFPNDIIVTADDDLYYPVDWLEKMVEEHKKFPKYIIGHRGREIKLDNKHKLSKYMDWDLVENSCLPTYKLLLTGAGGILYPPNSLNEQVFDKTEFLVKYPNNDDIWFWAMAVINKTKIKTFDNNYLEFAFVNPARDLNFTNEFTLFKINKDVGNYEKMKQILSEYKELHNFIMN